jgi:glucose/mannose-6-phosphate isomerase
VAEPLLDDPAALATGDPQGLVASYLSFGDQLRGAYAHAAQATIDATSARGVLFCGMGGSAAAGDLAAAAYEGDAPVPIQVLRGYAPPAWVGRDTLVICLSYSGNTEETLAACDEAAARGAHLVTISTGGALAERASRAGGTHIAVAPDAPQPRAALGSLTGAAIGALVAAGVLEDAESEIDEAAAQLQAGGRDLAPEASAQGNRAKQAAEFVGSRVPVVWGSGGVSQPAAWRWKCAFNENAKIPAFASSLPELNHHEVVGWTKGHGDGFCLVVLREPDEHPSVQPRLDATLPEVRAADVEVLEIRAQPRGPALARGLELMLVGDVASAYHGIAHGIDPGPIEAIARVKARLAEGT